MKLLRPCRFSILAMIWMFLPSSPRTSRMERMSSAERMKLYRVGQHFGSLTGRGRPLCEAGLTYGEDHINIVLDAKSEISLILLGEGGQVDVGVGKVDALSTR